MSKIEDIVCSKIQIRAGVGKAKYGVTMERADLSIAEWLTHLQEELMDASVYVERLLETYRAMEGFKSFVGRDLEPIKQHFVDTGFCVFTTKENNCGGLCPVCAGQDKRIQDTIHGRRIGRQYCDDYCKEAGGHCSNCCEAPTCEISGICILHCDEPHECVYEEHRMDAPRIE